MNTYNENLRVAVNNALSAINDTEQQRDSDVKIAHSNLYYSVGAQILATDKLDKVNKSYDETHQINDQGVSCSNRANNLHDTATLTNDNVTIMVTNTATAAQNTQVAANAVVKLAAEIGAASNIVNASEYDNDIYKLTEQVNDVIKTTSYQAELVSNISMESSADTAQITAQQVLDQATSTQTWFTDMLTRTSAELDTLTQLRIEDTETLITANTEQREREGLLKAAEKEYKAIVEAYDTSNDELNLNLTVTVNDALSAEVFFEKLDSAFPFKENSKSTGMTNEYYIGVKKYDTKDMFTLDIATTSFSSYYSDDANEPALMAVNRFVAVTPGTENKIYMGVQGSDAKSDNAVKKNSKGVSKDDAKDDSKKLELLYDVDGDLIQPGEKYVVFLYTVLDGEYKKYLNNYSDALSSPSQEFVLANQLLDVNPVPNKPVIQLISADNPKDPNAKDIKVVFEAPSKNPVYTEYRVILVPNESLCHQEKNDKAIAKEQEKYGGSEATFENTNLDPMNIWFDKNVAEQVADVNYRVAERDKKTDGNKDRNNQESPPLYTATFTEFATDNFGQLINHQRTYVIWVLGIITETSCSGTDCPPPEAFVSQLTRLATESCEYKDDKGDGGKDDNKDSIKVSVESDKTDISVQLTKDKELAINAKIDIEKKHEALTIEHNKMADELEQLKQDLKDKTAELTKLNVPVDDIKQAAVKKARSAAAGATRNTPANKTQK